MPGDRASSRRSSDSAADVNPPRVPWYKRFAFPDVFMGTMPRAGAWARSRGGFVGFTDACLRGIGQVFFCNSPLSGLLFLAAVVLENRFMCLCAVVGAFGSTLTAYAFGFDRAAVSAGLLGYNGVLASMGVGLFSFGKDADWSLDPQVWAAVFFVSAISVVFARAIGTVTVTRFKMAPFTLPFQLSVWSWLLAMQSGQHFPVNGSMLQPHLNTFPAVYPGVPGTDFVARDTYKAVFAGVGQVFFSDYYVVGIVCFIAIFVCSVFSRHVFLLGRLFAKNKVN
jgi:urea transporter